MARTVLALALLVSLATPAVAGQRCARRPPMIVVLPEVRLDAQGTWVRTRGETRTTGTLSPAAMTRIGAIVDKAKPEQIVRCIDALIAAPTGNAAKRACTLSAE